MFPPNPRSKPFPPYAYLPGHKPHPTRHPDGHSYGHPEQVPPPLQPDAWRESEVFIGGIALFESGYYWEAHEAWEGLWIAAGREGAVAELLKGLIKLAVAGLKVRQGLPDRVCAFGQRAGQHFERAHRLCDEPILAGFSFRELADFAAEIHRCGDTFQGSPHLDVEVVFERGLMPGHARTAND